MGIALEAALLDCDAALSHGADSRLIAGKGLALLRLGRLDEAIAIYDRALSTVPPRASALFGRSLAYAAKGELTRANADRREALKVDPLIEEIFAGEGITRDTTKNEPAS